MAKRATIQLRSEPLRFQSTLVHHLFPQYLALKPALRPLKVMSLDYHFLCIPFIDFLVSVTSRDSLLLLDLILDGDEMYYLFSGPIAPRLFTMLHTEDPFGERMDKCVRVWRSECAGRRMGPMVSLTARWTSG